MVEFNFDTKILAREIIAPIYNPYVSLGHIIVHHLKKYPRSVFQVCADDGSEMTCGEIAKLTTNFAKNMLKEGFTEGDVVGIVGRNSSHVTPVIFGCLMIGLPISPVDSKWGNFVSVFQVTHPKIIFCGSDIAERVKLWVESNEKKIRIVVITEKVEGFKHVTEYLTDSENVNM